MCDELHDPARRNPLGWDEIDRNAVTGYDVPEMLKRHARELLVEIEAEPTPRRPVRRGSVQAATERVYAERGWPTEVPPAAVPLSLPDEPTPPETWPRWWSLAVAWVLGFSLGCCVCLGVMNGVLR